VGLLRCWLNSVQQAWHVQWWDCVRSLLPGMHSQYADSPLQPIVIAALFLQAYQVARAPLRCWWLSAADPYPVAVYKRASLPLLACLLACCAVAVCWWLHSLPTQHAISSVDPTRLLTPSPPHYASLCRFTANATLSGGTMLVSSCGTVRDGGDPFVTVMSSGSPTGGAFTCHGCVARGCRPCWC